MVTEAKKQVVQEYSALLEEYPIVASINMANLPAKQLQNMREQLRSTVVLKCGKKRLMKIALEQLKDKVKGVDQLIPYLKGIPALLFTKENPFILYKTLEKNKSTAPAKAGQVASKDIIVPAGPTGFSPGPVIGELGSVGIKAGIDAGKVIIKEDSLVVKEGEVINGKIAALLTRLGVEPMEVGLDLAAVFEEGSIFEGKVLAIDEQEYFDKIMQGASWAFNLAVEIALPLDETKELLIQKAFREAKSLALEAGVLADGVVPELVAKAERTAQGLKQDLGV